MLMIKPETSWLHRRTKMIGGSDIAAVLNKSPWKNAYTLWLEKTGQKEPENLDNSMPVIIGKMLEPMILAKYEERTGKTLLPKPDIIYHPQCDYLGGSLDGLTDTCVVEAKSVDWSPVWGVPGTNQIPLHYNLQCQWYMMITGLPRADVAVLFGKKNIEVYTVEANPRLQEFMFEEAVDFWWMVETLTPPEPVTIDEVRHYYRRGNGLSIEATPEVAQAARRFKETQAEHEAAQLEIMRFMGENEMLMYDREPIVTWRVTKAGTRRFCVKGVSDE